ncbi:MAG: DUF115 domain-containing protein [Lachnospiraceae bacterium]|nr:DUF115 domain-containing protein [Lachnospiraceae bacterium]
MAEDFLERIYTQADVLQQLHDTVKYTRKLMLEKAFEEWNSLTAVLIELAEEISEKDEALAAQMINSAENVCQKWGDPAAFSSVIEGELIPLYKQCMKHKSCIDVEDGRYRFKSADSGYLTLYDSEQQLWLHEIHEPMVAAAELAEALYRPGMDEFHIFGCGLGYEAYQIYVHSAKSVKIVIYECDPRIVEMAFSYGVLDRIDRNMLEIVAEKDPNRLKDQFMRRKSSDYAGSFISYWEASEFSKYDGGGLIRERMVNEGEISLEDLWRINACKNVKRADISFRELRDELQSDEWIVVAAGPSLDDNMDFLKEAVGKIRIVTVETVLKKLLLAGVKPDVVTVADPKEAIMRYLEGIEDKTRDIPLVAGILTGWKYLHKYQGRVCLITEGENVLRYTEKKKADEIWNVGGTVSALAIETAVRLGARKVYVVGLDLAYPGGRIYAKGSDNDNAAKGEKNEWVESNDGAKVRTTPTFRFFKEQIEFQIARCPQVKFVNLSKQGARIKGMKIYKK